MTDEEKAEEYLRCKWSCGNYDRTNKRCIYKNRCISYQIYLDGLGAKRNDLEKENEQLKCVLYNTEANLRRITINCENLEKENAELKEKQKIDRQCEACKLGDLIVENTKLKEENAELRKEKEDLRRFAENLSEGHAAEWETQHSFIESQKIEIKSLTRLRDDLLFKLHCRDDELAEANARIHQLTQEAQAREATLNQKLRRTETKLKLAAQDYLDTKPAWFYGYGDDLEERARKQEELEDDCAEDKMALIKMEEEINGEE